MLVRQRTDWCDGAQGNTGQTGATGSLSGYEVTNSVDIACVTDGCVTAFYNAGDLILREGWDSTDNAYSGASQRVDPSDDPDPPEVVIFCASGSAREFSGIVTGR